MRNSASHASSGKGGPGPCPKMNSWPSSDLSFLIPRLRWTICTGGWRGRAGRTRFLERPGSAAWILNTCARFEAGSTAVRAGRVRGCPMRDRAVSLGGAVSPARVGGARIRHRALDRDAAWRALCGGGRTGAAGSRHRGICRQPPLMHTTKSPHLSRRASLGFTIATAPEAQQPRG